MAFTYNTVGISGFSGASNGSITATYNNTFTPGQAIYRTTGGYALAQANAISSCDVLGIVQTANSTSFTAVANGYMTVLTGLVDATEYYLSDQTAGLLTSTAPSANGSIIKPLLISTSTSTGVVVEYPGVQIGATNSGTSGYLAKWTGQAIGNSIVQDSGTQVTIGGNLSATGWVSEMTVTEYTTVSAAAPGATVQFDALTQSILYYSNSAVNNWTLNVRGNSTTPLSSVLNVGQTMTLALIVSGGSTGYYQTGMSIDSVSLTARWQGGSAPTSGDTSAIDIYTFSVLKTSVTPSYIVFGSVAKFA